LDDRHEGGVNPNAMEAVRFGRIVLALSDPLCTFARRRGHSPAEINEEIHAFCEALIATARP
jgi:hypothetical protein